MERQTLTSIFLLFIVSVLIAPSASLSSNSDSLRIEILLNSKIAAANNLNQKFTPSLEITTKNLILLSSSDQFFLLGWGGIQTAGKKVAGPISTFAFTSDSLLMVIRDKELCAFTDAGELSSLFTLPNESMGISAGKHVIYLYDRKPGLKRNALYLVARGKKYDKLLELGTPFYSVLEYDNSLIFSAQNGVFQFDVKNKSLKALAVLPSGNEVRSVAIDSSTNRIYFSSQNSLYTIKDSSILLLSDAFYGTLKYFRDGLIVLNPEEKYVIRITGLEKKIKSGTPPPPPPPPPPVVIEQPKNDTLTNTSIVNMVQSQLSDEMIISIISKSQVNFNMSVDSMIYLSNQNVSSAVIRAMKNAMKKQTEATPK